MKRDSTFKFVFWGLLAALVLLLITVAFVFFREARGEERGMVYFMFFGLFVGVSAYIVLVGTFVYKDATKRGLDPWQWTTIAVYIPNFIGLIIYLIMRQSQNISCVKCGKGIKKDFKLCPYCGQNQETSCENCKKEVATDWSTCPYCSHSLVEEKE